MNAHIKLPSFSFPAPVSFAPLFSSALLWRDLLFVSQALERFPLNPPPRTSISLSFCLSLSHHLSISVSLSLLQPLSFSHPLLYTAFTLPPVRKEPDEVNKGERQRKMECERDIMDGIKQGGEAVHYLGAEE